MQDYLHSPYDLSHPDTMAIFEECSQWSSRFGFLLMDNLELQANVHILDLACGAGFPLFELAHRYGSSCRLTGVDNWPEALERARTKLRIYNLPHVQLVEADAAQLSFPDETFDIITSNLGINNFADPATVLAECFRVARPGARLALTTNPIGHMQEFYAEFRATLHDLHKEHYLERLAHDEAHRGTRKSLVDLIQRHGFLLRSIKEDQFQFRYLDGTALFNHSLTKLGFLPSWRQIVDPADEELVFTHLENRLNTLAHTHGELRLTIPMLYLEAEKPA